MTPQSEIIVHSKREALQELRRQYDSDEPRPVRYGEHVYCIFNRGVDPEECLCCDVYELTRDGDVIVQWMTWHDWEDHGIGRAIQREIL